MSDETSNAILWKSAKASTDSFTVKPGVIFPTMLEATGMTADHLLPAGITFDAALEWNPVERTYSLTELSFHAPSSAGLSATMMRKLPVSDLRKAVIRAAMPSSFFEVAGRKEPEDYARLVTGRLTDELLSEVALRAAVRHGLYGDPNHEVMECFNVPQRTATHWIARARAQGFLD